MKIAMVFLDILKAFDKIWHTGLIYKLHKIGVRGKLLKLFKSYLTGRFQRVVLNGFLSECLEIMSGVPQGSILGPLLFLIFLNDIVNDINCEINLFADDTSLLSMDRNWQTVESELNKALSTLELWAENWLVTFNPSKTYYMTISNRAKINIDLNLHLNSSSISKVFEHKHLGIIFNNAFTWSNHIDYVVRKASKAISLVSRNKHSFNRLSLIKLFNTLVRPIIEYGSVVYDNLTLGDAHKLEMLLRRGALVCTGAISRIETTTLLRDLGWITLKQRRLISKLNLFYKIINGHVPDYLYEDYSLTQLAFDRKTTRSTLNVEIHVLFCRTNKYKFSYFPSTIVAWNSLSLSIRNLDSLSKFKRYLNLKYYPPENFFNYNLFSGVCSRIVTQARLGLCSLNFDLFRYTLTENPLCPNYSSLESLCHFLLVCPSYKEARVTFLDNLKLFLPNMDSFRNEDLSRVCVSGLEGLDFNSNYNILLATASFINSSTRFELS